MFIDASAIVGILHREPEKEVLEQGLDAATTPYCVSPLVMFEASVSLARAKLTAGGKLRRLPTAQEIEQAQSAVVAFVRDLGAEEVAISPDIGKLALEAAKQYGKAVGHPAELNFGDCFAYACASSQGVPLLFKGNDFTHTDIPRAGGLAP